MPLRKLTTLSLYVLLVKWCVKAVAVVAFLFMTAISVQSSRVPSELERILQHGTIKVISRNGPTTYFEGREGVTGFEYELAKDFADYLGVKLEVVEMEDLGHMINRVGTQTGDFAAAGLTVTQRRQRKVKFTSPYLQVSQQVIYRRGEARPTKITDLYNKRIMVISNSSHSETLRKLQHQHKELSWDEQHDLDMLDLLELVHNGKVDYTIIDSNAYEINHPLYPRAAVAFDLTQPQDLAWAFPKQVDDSLYKKAQAFFALSDTQLAISENYDRFYGHLGEINAGGAILFSNRIKTRLPKWENTLKAAADSQALDWHLLAALSYQESHWNPRAKSPTGVRGFMMLTLNTAKEVGVKNRLDAEQSIKGGAKYLKHLHRRLPERITEPDRTWLALAAYNIGLGHLEDARILTEFKDHNPDKWEDVKKHLPLLARRQFYKFTKHGYARGWEAVDYVQNIRNFHTILAWHEVEKQRLEDIAASQHAKNEHSEFSSTISDAIIKLGTTPL